MISSRSGLSSWPVLLAMTFLLKLVMGPFYQFLSQESPRAPFRDSSLNYPCRYLRWPGNHLTEFRRDFLRQPLGAIYLAVPKTLSNDRISPVPCDFAYRGLVMAKCFSLTNYSNSPWCVLTPMRLPSPLCGNGECLTCVAIDCPPFWVRLRDLITNLQLIT